MICILLHLHCIIVQHLREAGYKHVDGTSVKGSKTERAERVTPFLESKQVVFLRSMPLYELFMEELLTFPSSKHSDMVDAFTLLLARRPDILRMARNHCRPKRRHLPGFQKGSGLVSLGSFGTSSSTRDRYSERTGRSVF